MRDGKFNAEIIDTLGKRAALTCSSPDCGAITTGPTVEESSALNIGEAAHIYGRTKISARYKADLAVAEISDITNGIWLCRNCHKIVDNDPERYPAELLFQWRRRHETRVLERLGRPSDQMWEKIKVERLRSFENASYLAQQIVLDRPPYWEYKLTAEILRNALVDINERWTHLQNGMYVRKSTPVSIEELGQWLSLRTHDAQRIFGSISPLVEALMKAWGDPGVAGDERQIFIISNLIVSAARNLLEWEEDLYFVHVPSEFQDAVASLQGAAGNQLSELLRIPRELARIFEADNPTGEHKIKLVFRLPDDFADQLGSKLDRALKEYWKDR